MDNSPMPRASATQGTYKLGNVIRVEDGGEDMPKVGVSEFKPG